MDGLPQSGYDTVTPFYLPSPPPLSFHPPLFVLVVEPRFPTCQASALVTELYPILIVSFLNFPFRNLGAWSTVGDEDFGLRGGYYCAVFAMLPSSSRFLKKLRHEKIFVGS